jgi:hypothetical protein
VTARTSLLARRERLTLALQALTALSSDPLRVVSEERRRVLGKLAEVLGRDLGAAGMTCPRIRTRTMVAWHRVALEPPERYARKLHEALPAERKSAAETLRLLERAERHARAGRAERAKQMSLLVP